MVQMSFSDTTGKTTSASGHRLAQDTPPSAGKRGFDASCPDIIYTSRYSNKAIVTSGLVAVRVTRTPPRWKLPYTTVGFLDLAPTFAMLKAAKLPGGAKVFDDAFEDILERLDPKAIAKKLKDIQMTKPDARGVVLLCYEDVRVPGTRCHRLQVARWLGEKLGITVAELDE